MAYAGRRAGESREGQPGRIDAAAISTTGAAADGAATTIDATADAAATGAAADDVATTIDTAADAAAAGDATTDDAAATINRPAAPKTATTSGEAAVRA